MYQRIKKLAFVVVIIAGRFYTYFQSHHDKDLATDQVRFEKVRTDRKSYSLVGQTLQVHH